MRWESDAGGRRYTVKAARFSLSGSLSFAVLGGISMLLSTASAAKAADNLHIVPVAVEKVQLADYQPKLTLSGAIAARSLVDVAFRVAGQVVERSAEIGKRVNVGDVLARIDDAEQQTNLRSAQASRDAAQAQLVEATANFERQKKLLVQGFTTRSQYDLADQQARTAQGTLTSAESLLSNARDELSYTSLLSPVAGVVTARNVETGQVVQAAQTAFSIAEDGPRDAVFDVQETLVSHGRPGMAVSISLLSDPSVEAEGKIREVSPVVDAQTGTVRVKVGIAKTPPEMALGAIVTGSVHMPSRKVVILPWSVLTSDKGRPAVWRLAADTNVATSVPVRVLRFESEKVILESGLEEGEVVVTKGGQMLRSGEVADVVGAAVQ